MHFIVDAQLPPALAHALVKAGHRAEHVSEIGMQAASDAAIWTHADERGAAIVTKDEDFARRRVMVGKGPSIVWIRRPNTRRKVLLEWFAIILPEVVTALDRGETLIEIA